MANWEKLKREIEDLAGNSQYSDNQVVFRFMNMLAGLVSEKSEDVAREIMEWIQIIAGHRAALSRMLIQSMSVIAAYVPLEIHNTPSMCEASGDNGPPSWRIAEQGSQGFLVPDQSSSVVKGSGLDPEDAEKMIGAGITGF